MSICAIILAAGYSSRMQGKIKALLPFADTTMLGVAVQSLQCLDKQNIWVLTGYESQKIKTEAQKLGVQTIFNADFDQGMFSSICVGIRQLAKQSQAILILPVDAPMRPQTVQAIISFFTKSNASSEASLVIPYFAGQSGHPPIIASSHFQSILDFKQDGGLQAYFATLDSTQIAKLNLADQGIIRDLDTLELYKEAEKNWNNNQELNFAEASILLWQSDLPLGVIKHCYSVALGALRLGLALEARGYKVNNYWNICAGLLHDIKRLEKKHAQAASEYLASLALPSIAKIVAVHTNIPRDMLEAMEQKGQNKYEETFLLACLVVFMADKLHYEQEQVSVLERFKRTRAEYQADSEALKTIAKRESVALRVEKYLTELLAELPEEVIKRSSLHALESELLASQKAKLAYV